MKRISTVLLARFGASAAVLGLLICQGSLSAVASTKTNKPPSLALKSSGECVAGCTAFFQATAIDPDDDALTYEWSGCASGTGSNARCPITGSEEVFATVTVSDGRGGQASALVSAHGYAMRTASDFEGKHLLFNGYFSTPNGSTVFLGYAALRANGTAAIDFIRTAGALSDTAKRHNAMRLTPGYPPPSPNPNCQPGFIRAAEFSRVSRTDGAYWSFEGTRLKVYVPDVENDDDFEFSWGPEQGSQTQSLVLRRVLVFTSNGSGDAGGPPYGYGYVSSNSPYSSAPLAAAQFSPSYWGLSAQHIPIEPWWINVAPELTDSYMNAIGGFFPLGPAFYAPPLPLGYYSDTDPSVLGRTLLLLGDPASLYANHTLLLNYSDYSRPALSNTLMYFHGGHDFSNDGCYDPAADSGGHVLANLGVLEGGEMTKIVAIETSESQVYVLDRWFKVAYPIAIPPTVSVATPAGDSTVAGVVDVVAEASDDVAVRRVEFHLDGVLRSSVTRPECLDMLPPCEAPEPALSYAWDSGKDENGPHLLMVKAYDDALGSSSHAISVTVHNSTDTTPPAVAIAAPLAGAVVWGTVNVMAEASDNVAVRRVAFYVDGVMRSSVTRPECLDMLPPCEALEPALSYAWDSTTSENGPHSLMVTAYDDAQNSSSEAISVTVANAGTVP